VGETARGKAREGEREETDKGAQGERKREVT